MRWGGPPAPIGTIRQVRKFLLFPCAMEKEGPDEQKYTAWRWLETVTLVYKRRGKYNCESGWRYYWEYQGFADELLLDKIEGEP